MKIRADIVEWLRQASTTRISRVAGVDPKTVAANRAALLAALRAA